MRLASLQDYNICVRVNYKVIFLQLYLYLFANFLQFNLTTFVS